MCVKIIGRLKSKPKIISSSISIKWELIYNNTNKETSSKTDIIMKIRR